MPAANKTLKRDALSRRTRHGLDLIASELQLARKQRKMTQTDLANRIGCSRDTIRAIESGAPTVSICYILEAAFVLGIDLFGGASEMDSRLAENRAQLQLLPASRSSGMTSEPKELFVWIWLPGGPNLGSSSTNQ